MKVSDGKFEQEEENGFCPTYSLFPLAYWIWSRITERGKNKAEIQMKTQVAITSRKVLFCCNMSWRNSSSYSYCSNYRLFFKIFIPLNMTLSGSLQSGQWLKRVVKTNIFLPGSLLETSVSSCYCYSHVKENSVRNFICKINLMV